MTTKRASRSTTDELRPEYDFGELGKPVRGKYYDRATSGTNIVLLDPDVATAFPTPEAVNNALRMLVDVATTASKKKATRRKR